MAKSIPEIYPKLREALEQYLHDQAEWESKFAELRGKCTTSENWQQTRREATTQALRFVEKFRKVTEMDLAEEDIVAEDLLCLLKPVGEQLLPPEGPTDLRIWETFAAAKMQQKQFCIAAVYPRKSERGLLRNNFLVSAIGKRFKRLVNSFEEVHLSIQADITAELHNSLTNFTVRLNSCCEGMIRRMTWSPSGKICVGASLEAEMHKMTERWSRLSAQASQIAHQVAQLPLNSGSPGFNSLGSWSVVSEIPRDHGMGLEGLEGLEAENLEVGSVASVGSQSSCLSAHGGPHCFLPSHLFKVLRSDGEAPSLVWAQD
eukprot:s4213_g6.t1